MLRDLLILPEVKNWPVSLDAPETTLLHGRIIRKKKFLKRLYIEWYKKLASETIDIPQGKMIEIGSGAGFIKEVIPQVITSDILDLPDLDLITSAETLPFQNSSISAIYMIDTLHHIPKPYFFLKEATRVLKPGGKIVMIEPANSFWGRFIYRNFHHEPFEPNAGWEIPLKGPLSGANGALPWIIFERDRVKFEQKFSHLKIHKIKYHTPLRYLLSGGVSMKCIIPSWSFIFFRGLDRLLSTLFKQFSMFQTIVLIKEKL